MDLDWDRLGKALQAARESERVGLTQTELAAELGVGRSVIQLIEGGNKYTKPTQTIRAYARRVGWTDASVERVLAGGEPELAEETATAPREIPGLPGRVQYELRQDGALVDTAVIDLPGGGSAVVIVKDQPGATPEQRQQNLEAWLQAQSKLKTLDYTDSGSSAVESNDV